jgi:hypothetical protein
VWLAAGALLGLIAYCVFQQWWLGAIVAAALVVILVGGWAYRAGAKVSTPVGSLGGPYGNGPYRKVESGPTLAVVDALAEMAAKLRELPEKQPDNWNVDWHSFDAIRRKAAAAAEAGQLGDAVRHYCHAVRDIMRQLRGHRPTLDDDSSDIHPTPA